MFQSRFPTSVFVVLFVALVSLGCGSGDEATFDAFSPSGTPELRAALFDSILTWTAQREAFSAPKQEALVYDPLEEMADLRDEFVAADDEQALYYALVKLSNARKDRHLSVGLVDLGLLPGMVDGLPVFTGSDTPEPKEAPIRFRPDFGPSGGYFVADLSQDAPPGVAIGDRLEAFNGVSAADLEPRLAAYIRHSSVPGLRWKLAEALSLRTAILPPSFVGDELTLRIRQKEGSIWEGTVEYGNPESQEWSGVTEPSYPGFRLEWSTPTHDLYLPTDGQRAIILQWHRFEGSTLIQDMDRLVAFGEEEGLLDHAVIFDATRSGGGSLGAYAVQRIQPKPFKTTFGTVRLSDIVEPFIQMKREEFEENRVFDGGGPETVDDGTWLMDWLDNDLYAALDRGDSITMPVPFKLAHAPKDSDGVLQPAPVHFRGPLVVFCGPNGGSHLDQFISIVADNDLGPIIGMPTGGYSNTWEWYEVLQFPGTRQPVAGFMWSIGHTVRPNGEVLEGNPAPVDRPVPLTAENAEDYYDLLLDDAFAYLVSAGFEVGG